MVAVHTVIAIVLVIALIIKVRVDPVISLVVGSLYLGLAAGVGFAGTLEAITVGFGGIMAEVGLLIGFGVLIGALLHSSGAFRRLVGLLVKSVGAGRLPYALTSLLAVVMPSIYVDVQVVLAAPVARSASPFIGRTGLPVMASALGGGIFAGYVFVIPGLAAISIAGLLDIQLGAWLLYGLVIGLVAAVVSTTLMRILFSAVRFWDPETDEEVDEAMAELEAADASATGERVSAGEAMSRAEDQARETEKDEGVRRLPLLVLMLPILVPLVLIAFGAFAELGGWSTTFIAFLGDANLALFLGLLGAYVLTRMSAGAERTSEAMTDGFHTTGEILLITGVGGSLGAVIEATGLDSVLGDLFQADEGAPVILSILLAWFIAAVLHLAIGSVSVAAITAAGIIAPILDSLAVSPIVIGLAIASGAMFALQVNSNFFWMFKSLLGLSTKGTLKTLTLVTSVASVVSLPLVMLAALIA
ncbi:GntP family permease [Aeromicrobium sp. 636]|uniref:GntP family permease n=1 Tax=Aeromicrobium senzhongii TaxID=2663859 RepID=A0A8I0ETM1_9ACTN|nr:MULTISPECIES: SLC13 family permease [Aeromicrobium]MBC9225854.1 GntP family permease [Aeromicrobium senzhongii]MCQ3997961.1 GntP family permease [Aeromicrobium sp. 636]MTB87889.1 GntP family permease [Aeromicrobium senzhongii]QNL95091.1 GntP family permease [Aeromicrobium senzhongii]